MKTNGLNMYNYWLVNAVFNYCSYLTTAFLYFFAGRYLFDIDYFANTSCWLFLEMFGVWGLCQVSLSMFYCSLFSSA
jgi:hypothetical protein